MMTRHPFASSDAHVIERHARVVMVAGVLLSAALVAQATGVEALAETTEQASAQAPAQTTTAPANSGSAQSGTTSAEPAEKSKPAFKEPSTTEPASTEPSLDDLLGTSDGTKPVSPSRERPSEGAADQPASTAGVGAELERRLTAQEMGDAFEQAIRLMGDAANRLEGQRDVGLPTQRLQEDVLRKLDELIAQIEQNQQQQQSSSSSSSSSKSQQDPSQSQQQSSKNQKKPASKGEKSQQQAQAGETSDPQGSQAPGLQTGALRPALESAPAAWGSLPARVRDMLLQGAGDKFSTTWEKATENYYRRLAEEQKTP